MSQTSQNPYSLTTAYFRNLLSIGNYAIFSNEFSNVDIVIE
ncbi:unnamed protein product [Acidithrix sp. C25]|nr:unnamed protein product [Acidithrix sp. C25]